MAKAISSKGRHGSKKGPPLWHRLSEPEFRERVQVTEREMRALDMIASGQYVRNAAAIIRAIEVKIDCAYPKQVQRLEVTEKRERKVEFASGRTVTPAAAGLPDGRLN